MHERAHKSTLFEKGFEGPVFFLCVTMPKAQRSCVHGPQYWLTSHYPRLLPWIPKHNIHVSTGRIQLDDVKGGERALVLIESCNTTQGIFFLLCPRQQNKYLLRSCRRGSFLTSLFYPMERSRQLQSWSVGTPRRLEINLICRIVVTSKRSRAFRR